MRFGNDKAGIEITIEGGVADVRLDRPDKLNAMSPPMFEALGETIDWLSGQDKLRCVVLSGNGRSFCVGLDLASLDGGIVSLEPRTHGIANWLQHVALGWRNLPMPVVTAITGHAFGAGLQIALGADIRLASPDAQLSFMEMRHGLVPDLAAFVLARGVIREDVFRDLVYTARKVSGEEAASLGLVTRISSDPLAEAKVLAQHIAEASPDAIRAAKQLFAQMGDAEPAAMLLAESQAQQRLIAKLAHSKS